MKALPGWFRAMMRIVGTIAPPLAATIAYRLFWRLGPAAPVKPAAREVHDRARSEVIDVGDRRAVLYRWGDGPETILLVHGWRGRASQFADIVRALESPQRTIVAFDAPGNGDAPGDQTDMLDYLSVIRMVADEADRLDLIVGHSFGVMAVFVAVREGVATRGIVSIAGVSGIEYTISTFTSALALPARAERILRRKLERSRLNQGMDIWQRYVSELAPTDDATPLLVIHDADDRSVDFSEGGRIAEAHLGPVVEVHTEGLGHSRVLSDPAVLESIVTFAATAARTR